MTAHHSAQPKTSEPIDRGSYTTDSATDASAGTPTSESDITVPGNTIRSVDRALDLLMAVCSPGAMETGCSLAECAKNTGLSPSTSLRFLRSLSQRGFVTRDKEGLFHPGAELLRLGATVLSRDNLIRIADPTMKRLVKEIDESVYLAVLNASGDCLYVAIEECSQSIRHVSWVGKTIPAQGSAAGEALSGKVKLGASAVESNGVEPDVTAISSPIIVGGKPVAALSILAPSYRMFSERTHQFATKLEDACRQISDQLGS